MVMPMDNCMTCNDQKCCPLYGEYGIITGCYEWRPIDSLVVEQGEIETDSLRAAQVILMGSVIRLAVWAIIWALIVIF